MRREFKWYTDGIKTIKVYVDTIIPDGFYPGRTYRVNTWNKGLTKYTDDRVKLNGQATGATRRKRFANNEISVWNKGLTKECSESLQVVSQKVSISRKGKSAWNKGLSKSTDERVAKSAAKSSKTKLESHRPAPNKGKSASLQSRQRMSEAQKRSAIRIKEADPEFYTRAYYKGQETKKLNGTINSSTPEKLFLEQLISKYGQEDVEYQHKDDQYPFMCDFYIKSEKLYIEYNGTIEHMGHPYDINDPNDAIILNNLIEKANQSKRVNSRYWNIIKWWTEIDPYKLSILRQNNLNFRIIYPLSGIEITS